MTFRYFRKLQEFWAQNPPTDILVGIIASAFGYKHPALSGAEPAQASSGSLNNVPAREQDNQAALTWLMGQFPGGVISG